MREGNQRASHIEEASPVLFSTLCPDGPLMAALLIRRTGVTVSSWSRDGIPHDVLAVMTCTMLGSIDTLMESLGCPTPQTVTVEAEDCRLLSLKADPKHVLVLVAPRSVGEAYLRHEANLILNKLALASSSPHACELLVPVRE